MPASRRAALRVDKGGRCPRVTGVHRRGTSARSNMCKWVRDRSRGEPRGGQGGRGCEAGGRGGRRRGKDRGRGRKAGIGKTAWQNTASPRRTFDAAATIAAARRAPSERWKDGHARVLGIADQGERLRSGVALVGAPCTIRRAACHAPCATRHAPCTMSNAHWAKKAGETARRGRLHRAGRAAGHGMRACSVREPVGPRCCALVASEHWRKASAGSRSHWRQASAGGKRALAVGEHWRKASAGSRRHSPQTTLAASERWPQAGHPALAGNNTQPLLATTPSPCWQQHSAPMPSPRAT
eukprot:363932-Chlamydomonas_euryale.AAC.17